MNTLLAPQGSLSLSKTLRATGFGSRLYIRAYLQVGLRLTDQQVFLTHARGRHGRRRWLQALGVGRRTYVPVFDSLDSQLDQLWRLQPDFLLPPAKSARWYAQPLTHMLCRSSATP